MHYDLIYHEFGYLIENWIFKSKISDLLYLGILYWL
jgi:hypothetical protein